MSSRITYNAATAFGQLTAEFVSDVLVAKERGRRLMAALNAMTDNGTATWTQIETEVGGMAAGNGQPFFTIVSAAVQKLNVAAFDDLAKIDQG